MNKEILYFLKNRIEIGLPINHIDLSNCDLTLNTFENLDLSGCNLSGANLTGSKFKNCDLSEADFTNATLGLTIFRNCNLAFSKFNRCNIKDDTLFGNCDLTYSNFGLASIERNLTFVKCKLNYSNFNGIKYKHIFMVYCNKRKIKINKLSSLNIAIESFLYKMLLKTAIALDELTLLGKAINYFNSEKMSFLYNLSKIKR